VLCFRAIVEKYLLEKSRIVSQTENERCVIFLLLPMGVLCDAIFICLKIWASTVLLHLRSK